MSETNVNEAIPELLPPPKNTSPLIAKVTVKFFLNPDYVEVETDGGYKIPDGRFEKALPNIYWALGKARAAALHKQLKEQSK